MISKVESGGVIHVVQRLGPGGIETLALDLVRASPTKDRIFSLEGRTNDLIAAWPILAGFKDRIEAFDRKNGVRPGLVREIARRLRQLKPSAIVVHHLGPLLYGGLAGRMGGVGRIVHVEHDAWHYRERKARTISAVCERLVRPAHIAVSEEVASRLRSIVPHASITVIAPGIDTERYRPRPMIEARERLGLPIDRRIVGSVGRLMPVKGHAVLVAAMPHLPPDVDVALVGNGDEAASLERAAAVHGMRPRLHMLGLRDDVHEILPAFDVFCLPSLAEGLPRGVLEAQSCGLPVVASDVGALRQAVAPATSRLVPPSDPIALAEALRDVLARPKQPDAARSFVEERFSWSRTVDGYRQVIEGR